MVAQSALRAIDRQKWLKPVDSAIAQAITKAFGAAGPAGLKVKDFLNGVWLGHPLHPVLVDVPIGAWTTATTLDVFEAMTGREEFSAGADGAIAIGIGVTLPAAITGLADWQYLVGQPRRIGLVHGLLNVGALALYTASLLMRRSGARGAGQVTAALGLGTIAASSWLGGHLVYRHRAQVNHANEETMPRRFVPVMAEADLPEGKLTRAEARGTPVVLLRRGDRIYALAETCSHLGGPLAEGKLADNSVICPWHGSRFSFEDGHVITGPATSPQPCFETRVQNGQIEVRLARRA